MTVRIFAIGTLTARKDEPPSGAQLVSDPTDEPRLQSTNGGPDNGKSRSVLHTQRQAMTWIREQVQASFSAYADAVWIVALMSLAGHQAEERRTHTPLSRIL